MNRNVFVPLYVKGAALSDDGDYIIPYMIPKWDGKVLWMNINRDKSSLFIQPLYLDDASTTPCPGCMELISTAMLYKQKGKDYSAYLYGAALMYMYISLDANMQVKDYTIDVYDQDDNLAQQGVKLNIGDEVQKVFIENDADETSKDWEFVSLENPTVVTREPQFKYAGYIPGRDFITDYSNKIDLPQTDILFRFVGYVVDTATDTVIQTKYSQRQKIGTLRDNVCAAYPQLTTKAPNLADVIEGLRILASLAPQHF